MRKKEKRSRIKMKRAVAFSEIFLMILSSLAFAFILGGMGVLSMGGDKLTTLK